MAIVAAASQAVWTGAELAKFFLLVGCGLVSVAATPRIAYGQGGIVTDFLTVWVLPVAILLPPVYAMLAPIPLLVLTQVHIHRGIVYRRVFTAGAIGLSYGVASLLFHALPASFAGPSIGSGLHALTWALAVAACEVVGWLGHDLLIVAAIKLTDPTARLKNLMFNREALHADLAQIDLGVLTTVVVAVSPVLAVFAVPTVLLVRRFLIHAQLVAQSRYDAKTGLLNVSTWESEATLELVRAARTRSPVALALIDIDHFKSVNDTYGHLVGDKVLRAVTDGLRSQLREYDLAGRFGGEEFVILFPQTTENDARHIAERLRNYVAGMSVPAGESEDSACIKLTISIGVASLNGSRQELTDLIAAADAALYYAKQAGRNRTHVYATATPPVPVTPSPSPVTTAPLDGQC
ncbi:MAG: GGDEF domain-containing protein [Streptosporangiaceae bacterium]|nr:GGDEF domain-containing protein [Streptosporangiaceae bacterium]MBV9854064.1 GGDEF domain-containing protein [Streptosporangiaceae bacterium]